MQRTFIYAEFFERALRGRKRAAEVLETIESKILENPNCGAVVPGTGGVRKFRSEDFARGKG